MAGCYECGDLIDEDECYCKRCWQDRGNKIKELMERVRELEEKWRIYRSLGG